MLPIFTSPLEVNSRTVAAFRLVDVGESTQHGHDVEAVTVADGPPDMATERASCSSLRSGKGSANSVIHILSRTAPTGAVLERRVQWLTEVHRS